MDPIALILSALSVAARPVADQAVKDAYLGLKALIIRKFAATTPELEPVLARYEQKPEVWQEPVKEVLHTAGVDQDQEVIARVTELLEHLERADPGTAAAVVGQINAQGGRVVTIGGDQTGTLNMGDNIRNQPR